MSGTYPFDQGGTRDLNAGPGKNLFVVVQRQVVGILGPQHLGQQPRGGDAFVDHLCRASTVSVPARMSIGSTASQI